MKKVVEIYIKILTNKNYSKKTIETYVCYLEKFLNDVNKNPYHITTNEIRDYLLNKTYSSISVQNQIIGSLKLFAKYILNKKDIHLNKLERPRKEKRLPQVIDKDFILERISKIENLKHKAIISLAFSVGLRVSEVINLKIADVDSKRMLINIRQAKGKKDRIVPLSITILDLLRLYFKKYKPNEYLFNGQFSNQYSSTRCNQLVKKYLGHDYHFHTLRHSSFTTMLESGIDLSIIQKIAGHNNPKTTQIYTHISNQMLNRIQLPI
jgi:site-specific recombinase XerD